MRLQNGQGLDLPALPLAWRYMVDALFDAGPYKVNGAGAVGMDWADCLAYAATGEIGPEDVRVLFHMSKAYAHWIRNDGLLSMAPVDLDQG